MRNTQGRYCDFFQSSVVWVGNPLPHITVQLDRWPLGVAQDREAAASQAASEDKLQSKLHRTRVGLNIGDSPELAAVLVDRVH
jgi:hypothetical protein